MNRNLFDRIAKSLVRIGPRREAIQALARTGFAAVAARLRVDGAAAKKKRKKNRRCRKRLQTCGGRKKCCNSSGLVQCQTLTKQDCFDQNFSGRRCCGLDGASCNPAFDDCDCCGDIECFDLPGGARCVENPK